MAKAIKASIVSGKVLTKEQSGLLTIKRGDGVEFKINSNYWAKP